MPSQTQGFRLSPQQRQAWALQKGSQAYYGECRLLLEGRVDTNALQEAIRNVVETHEILRTVFARVPGMRLPIQVVLESPTLVWQPEDLTSHSAATRGEVVSEIVREKRSEPFNFAQGPLLRTSLLSLSPQKHLLILTLPALCADTRTLHNLVRQIASAYAGGLHNDGAQDQPMQYVEFAEWQNDLLEDEQVSPGKKFWQRQTTSPAPTLTVPFERTNSETSFTAEILSTKINSELVTKLCGVASRYQSSCAILLHACWQVLLWRLNDQPDVMVSLVCEGRKYEEMQDALGPFAKRLPVRIHIEESSRFNEILKKLEAAVSEASDWCEYFIPDEPKNEEHGASAISSRVGFSFEERPAAFSVSGVTFSIERQHVCFDPCKVELTCVKERDSLAADFRYDAGLFEAEDIRRLGRQFHALLESVVEEPEAAVSKLNFMAAADRRQLLVERNDTRASYRSDTPVHKLFEEQVARTPEAVAVIFKDQRLTYAELNRRANQIAHHLLKRGAMPEALIGLHLERSPEMIIGLLGVLKAGGAYVPLDPSYPSQRLAFMLEDARVSLILSRQELVASLPQHSRQVITLDGAAAKIIGAESTEDPTIEAAPENLAYVIYTSGSTGRPKGVAIPHRGLVNYLTWSIHAYKVLDGKGAPVHSPLGFDLTITSLFTPLLVGRPVVLIPEEQGIDGLGEALSATDSFSLVKITPSHLEALSYLLSAGERAGGTRALVIGGEQLHGESLTAWRTRWPETRLINEYGPTETVVGCCVYEIPAGAYINGPVPIGRPIANTKLYVLDRGLQPLPVGVRGELYIGGDGLARGYLNRPELTAEQFVPDPFSGQPGARLYRTGDVARYLPNATLEFVGRVDEQMKIHGFRIEPGEVEAVICMHSRVREAAVIARDDMADERRLVAYVVAETESEVTVKAIRDHLSQYLPDYMIPSAFVMLKTLPLTAHGKVDRGELPAPDRGRTQVERAFLAPRTQTEVTVARIWGEVLGLESVGVDDNFFELGGHSLLATQVVSRVRAALKVELPLRSLFFDAPTVALLARMIEDTAAVQPIVELTEIKTLPRREEVKLDQLLAKVEQLSDAEARAMLQQKKLRPEI